MRHWLEHIGNLICFVSLKDKKLSVSYLDEQYELIDVEKIFEKDPTEEEIQKEIFIIVGAKQI